VDWSALFLPAVLRRIVRWLSRVRNMISESPNADMNEEQNIFIPWGPFKRAAEPRGQGRINEGRPVGYVDTDH